MTDPILPLEKQVPPFETCRQLAEAGFPQGTAHVWVSGAFQRREVWSRQRLKHGRLGTEWRGLKLGESILPAPTDTELGAVLPRRIELPKGRPLVFRSSQGFAEYTPANESLPGEGVTFYGVGSRARLYLFLHRRDLLPASACGREVA